MKVHGSTIVDGASILNVSKTISNILLTLSIVIAVILGAFIGVKTMIASTEEKAEIKESLLPYLIGAGICFGGFSIWSIIVTLIENIA